MIKPEPRLLTPPGRPKRSSGESSNGRPWGRESPPATSACDWVEIFTTVGLSLAANSTKSGKFWGLTCWPSAAESSQRLPACTGAAAAAQIRATSTSARGNEISRTSNIETADCFSKARRQVKSRSQIFRLDQSSAAPFRRISSAGQTGSNAAGLPRPDQDYHAFCSAAFREYQSYAGRQRDHACADWWRDQVSPQDASGPGSKG